MKKKKIQTYKSLLIIKLLILYSEKKISLLIYQSLNIHIYIKMFETIKLFGH